MKTQHYILFIFICLTASCYAQEFDMFDFYHWNPEDYRSKKVYKCLVTNRDFKEGLLVSENLERIELYDTLGRIAVEKEFFDSDTTDGWHTYYKYDLNSRITETEYFWLDTKDWEKDQYYYDSKNMLIRYCELSKPNKASEYVIDDCFTIHRIKNRISYVTDSNQDTVHSYLYDGETAYQYSSSDSLVTEYENGYLIMKEYTDKVYYYERYGKGQIIKTTIVDHNGKIIGETIFEYTEGLPMKITSYDENLRIKYQETYKYLSR